MPADPTDAPPPATVGSARRALVEGLTVYGLATAAAAILYQVKFLEGWFHALVAAIFLYLPATVLRRESLDRYGLTADPLRRNLMVFAGAVALIFPLFFGGFIVWQKLACALAPLRPLAPGGCGHAALSFHLRLPPEFVRLAAAEVLVVALPEEFFFRGYLQERLREAWPDARKLLGAPILPVVVASALFALTHLAVQGNPGTLAVFFPGLVFGWMRATTGSVLAGTLFHALCNLYMETLLLGFFG